MALPDADLAREAPAQGTAAKVLRSFRRDTRGATAIEYGLIAALMAVTIITSLSAMGGSNQGSWGQTADKAAKAMNPAPPP